MWREGIFWQYSNILIMINKILFLVLGELESSSVVGGE